MYVYSQNVEIKNYCDMNHNKMLFNLELLFYLLIANINLIFINLELYQNSSTHWFTISCSLIHQDAIRKI